MYTIDLTQDVTFIKVGANPDSALFLGAGTKVHMKKSRLLARAGPVTIKRASEIGNSVPFRLIGLFGAEVVLEEVSLEGGLLLTGYGGGIDAFESSLTLLRSRISDCSAPKGGGISLRSNSVAAEDKVLLSLFNSTITGNTATESGSGIWASHTDRVTITTTGTNFLYGNTPGQSCASGSGWTGQIQDSSTLQCSDCTKGKWSISSVTQGICVDCPRELGCHTC